MFDFVKKQEELILTHEGYSKITGHLKDGTTTLLEMLQLRAESFPDAQVLGAINRKLEIEYMTFRELDQCARKLAKHLAAITQPGEIVGIASLNRPEWAVAEFATYYANCVNSPLYTTFKEEALSYILSTTGMRVLVATPSFAEMIVRSVLGYLPAGLIKLEHIVLIDGDEAVERLCAERNIKTSTYCGVLFGERSRKDEFYGGAESTICAKAARFFKGSAPVAVDSGREVPTSTDLATINFTSGTTGVPKGAELTHQNFIAQIEGFEIGSASYGIIRLDKDVVYFSYLPLSHVFERIVFCVVFSTCGRIVFFRGDKLKIGEDIKLVRPSFISAVPKILQTFHQKIEEEISKKSVLVRAAFRAALGLKIFLQAHGLRLFGVLDRLVLGKVAQSFGGEIRHILCGGAAVDAGLIEYMQAVLDATIFQGYGQTEGLGANALAPVALNDAASIGIPFPSTRFKLVDINTNGPDSEKAMYLKGYSITRGYFQPPTAVLDELLNTGKFAFKKESIRESPFDEAGWLNTGDVVTYRDGKLYIVGRSKDLVKLTNGEYISCEDIENKLKGIAFVSDLFVTKIVDSDKFVAVVSVQSKTCSAKFVAASLRKTLQSLVANWKIPKVVDIERIAIVPTRFEDIEGGILFTPTLKKKRYICTQKFEKEISNAVRIDSLLDKKTE